MPIYVDEADGIGYMTETVEGPFRLELTGLGEDYFISVSLETEDGPAFIESEGFLAEGEQLTLDVPLIDAPTGTNDIFDIVRGSGITTIPSFGGVGVGLNPSSAVLSEVDTLKFEGAGLTANNLLLAQSGNDLVISFAGIDDKLLCI